MSQTPEQRVAWKAKKLAEDPEGFRAKEKASREKNKAKDPEAYREYHRLAAQKRRAKNGDAVRAYRKQWTEENRDKINATKRARRAARTEEEREADKLYDQSRRKANPARAKAWMDAWRSKSVEHEAAYRKANKERHYISSTSWRNANKDRVNARTRERYATDPHFNARIRLSSRLTIALRRAQAKKSAPTMKLVGCSPEALVAHIESLFLPGMTWENRDQWHLDHYAPCSMFNLDDPFEQNIAFHFLNLRPLWGDENCSKSDSLPEDIESHLNKLQEAVGG